MAALCRVPADGCKEESVSNVKFIGQHRVREGADAALLPEASESGFWQAWEMPSGAVMLQALNNGNKPVGPLLSFEKEQFSALFKSTSVGSTKQTRRASSPNLLFQWYEQMLQLDMAESDEAMAPAVFPVTGAAPGAQAMRYGGEYGLPEYTGTGCVGIPSPPPASFVSSMQPPAAVAQPPSIPTPGFPDMPPPAGPQGLAASPDPQAAAEKSPSLASFAPVAGMEPTETQEEELRQQFAAIVRKAGEGFRQEALLDLRALMLQPAFLKNRALHRLYTEFGLDLRREKHYEMALQCHLQALEVSPENERVLFNIARTQFELGQKDSAREYLMRALEADPEFALAQNFLYFLDGGQE